MKIVRKIPQVRRCVAAARAAGQRVGFVPTMGALHEGHLSLMKAARAETDFVVVSIFVNPTQFGPREDFNRYPRDLKADSRLCAEVGVDLVFAPNVEEIYPPGFVTYVVQEGLTEVLCGPYRPGHFRGVTTVVTKLFNIVQPDVAYFGQKDYQQSVVIRRMTKDLDLPVKIRVLPTVRDKDGLAMSSRNTYLTAQERTRALCLFNALSTAKEMVTKGERSSNVLLKAMNRIVRPMVDKVDYISIVHPDTLQDVSTVSNGAVAAIAAWVGKTRLIDNMILVPARTKSQRSKERHTCCA